MTAAMGRRGFLVVSSAIGIGGALGCATGRPTATAVAQASALAREPLPWKWSADERPLVLAPRPDFDIVTRGGDGSRVLRLRTRPVSPGVDLSQVSQRLEATMLGAKGVGLAGPQVGLNLRVATLMLDYKSDKPRTLFFRNPVIVERSDDNIDGYEGCLSIPGVGGMVRRSSWVRVSHDTIEGETQFEEAQGYNAVLWQHELDHLEGILYVDKLLGELLPMDEVRRRREELDKPSTSDEPQGSAWFARPHADIMIA